jgi:hypothetical protein
MGTRIKFLGSVTYQGLGTPSFLPALPSWQPHRPLVEFAHFRVEGIGNDLFFIEDVLNRSVNEDAADVNIKSEAIDLKTKRARREPDVIWPHLAHGQIDHVRIKLSSIDYPYLLMCITYKSEQGITFSDHAFFVVAGLRAGATSGGAPPTREEQDALEANFPCANVK